MCDLLLDGIDAVLGFRITGLHRLGIIEDGLLIHLPGQVHHPFLVLAAADDRGAVSEVLKVHTGLEQELRLLGDSQPQFFLLRGNRLVLGGNGAGLAGNGLILLGNRRIPALDFTFQGLDFLFLFVDDLPEAGDQFPLSGILLGQVVESVEFGLDVADPVLDLLDLGQAGRSLLDIGPEGDGASRNLGQFLQDLFHGFRLFDILFPRRRGTFFQLGIFLLEIVVLFLGDISFRRSAGTGYQQKQRKDDSDYFVNSHTILSFSKRMVVLSIPGLYAAKPAPSSSEKTVPSSERVKE